MKANYECDLHGHTNRSDGNDSPLEYLLHAEARGLKVIAITDHDVRPPEYVEVDGEKKEITAYAKERNLHLIKGIEISCETKVDDVHLVCFGCDWNNSFFDKLEDFTVKSKVESYKKLVAVFQEYGWDISWDAVLNNNGNTIEERNIQKKIIFELLANKGYAKSWQEAKLMVKTSSHFDIKREKPDAVNVIKEIHAQGGIIILAHPYLITEPVLYKEKLISRSDFIEELIKAGLDGIEACYTYDKTSYNGKLTPEQIKKEIIEKYKIRGLIISGGSDYHGDGKKGVKNPREVGECGITMSEFQQYKELLML